MLGGPQIETLEEEKFEIGLGAADNLNNKLLVANNLPNGIVSCILYSIKLRQEKKGRNPMFSKKIVCLANSRKLSGKCVAGKEHLGDGSFGTWIRPVSNTPRGELSIREISFKMGDCPELLDIVSVPLLKSLPQAHQVENYLIAPNQLWKKEQKLDKVHLVNMLDNIPTLWSNGNNSYNGLNDRVSEEDAKKNIRSSLVLIKPESLIIHVEQELQKKKVRAKFRYNGVEYWLVITDPIETKYKSKAAGDYKITKEVFLCISLGEPYEGWCYKLVAGVMT